MTCAGCLHSDYCIHFGCPFQRDPNSSIGLAPSYSVSALIGFQKDRLCSEASALRSAYGIQGDHERANQSEGAA